MRAASDAAPHTDLLSLAILVALNLADECVRARQQQSSSYGELSARALELEQLVDQALSESGALRVGSAGFQPEQAAR